MPHYITTRVDLAAGRDRKGRLRMVASVLIFKHPQTAGVRFDNESIDEFRAARREAAERLAKRKGWTIIDAREGGCVFLAV